MDINKKAADDKVVPPNPEVDGVIKHTDEQTGAVLYLETNPPQEPPKTNNTPVAGELPLLK